MKVLSVLLTKTLNKFREIIITLLRKRLTLLLQQMDYPPFINKY